MKSHFETTCCKLLNSLKRACCLGVMGCGLASAAVPFIIYDSDFGPDVDDVGALAVLHRLADLGECRILAMGNSTSNNDGPSAMDAVNHYYQRPNIPIGAYKRAGELHSGSNYTNQLTKEFPNDVGPRAGVLGVVTVYRRALAKVPDSSVKIVVVGFNPNLEDLLKSAPDEYSPLNGKDLVKKKVIMLSSMGGAFPSGSEFNFQGNGASTQYVAANWPTPIVFSGFELGSPIRTGSVFNTKQITSTNPVGRAYELYTGFGNTRESWDLTSALYAVRPDGAHFNLSAEGCVTVQSNGANGWDAARKCGHRYLIKKLDYGVVAKVLDSLMIAPVVPQAQKPDYQPVSNAAPNPSFLSDSFVQASKDGRALSIRAEGVHSLRVFGFDGQIIFSRKGGGRQEYRLPDQAGPGIYFVSFSTDREMAIRKWVVR